MTLVPGLLIWLAAVSVGCIAYDSTKRRRPQWQLRAELVTVGAVIFTAGLLLVLLAISGAVEPVPSVEPVHPSRYI